MEFMHSYAFQHWAAQFLVVLFLAGGFVALTVGVSLITGSAVTLQFFVFMNRWVSTRRALRPIEVLRDTRQAVLKHRRGLALVIIAGGAFVIVGLGIGFDARAMSFMLGLDTRPSSVAVWLVESARWVLIAGNLAAVVIAIMLVVSPDALAALEVRGGRWYSDRQLVKGADKMHFALDNWIAASPRSAGWIIAIAGLVLLGDFGIMWSGLR